MFKKLYNKFFNKSAESPSKVELGYLKFTLYRNDETERITGEINIKEFSEESANHFAEILFLLHIGALTDLSIQSLNMISNKDFINQVLVLLQQEFVDNKDPLEPVVSPIQALRYDHDHE